MDLQINILSIRLENGWYGIDILNVKWGFYEGWYGIDILNVKWGFYEGSLLYIGILKERIEFDILYMRELFLWIKNKLK